MCIYCQGKIEPDKTDYIEKVGNHVTLIKDVPCEKCKQCGEIYYSNNIVKAIEKIINSIQQIASELSLTVIDYNKNAA
jgi:YgiT-type zinc finger domain-containing protein